MGRMRQVGLVGIGLVLCFSLVSCEEDKKETSKEEGEREKIAREAADSWLQLVDTGNYDESWEEAAEYLRGAVAKEQFRKSLEGVREPLGKVSTRTVKSAKYFTSLPGAPDGEYVVIQYKSSFEKKKEAIETVTPMKEEDGKWRVSGYYIK